MDQRSERRFGLRWVRALPALALGGSLALSPLASAFAEDYGPNTCLEGFVWRGAFPNDYVCVQPRVREQVVKDNRDAPLRTKSWLTDVHGRPSRACRDGFVWREAGPNDQVCVLIREREQAKKDNREAASRRKYTLCESYAALAVAQNETNVLRACGLTGPRWHSSYNTHFRWCLDVPGDVSGSESRARSIEIGPCLNRTSAGPATAQASLGVSLQFAPGDLANRNLVVTGSNFQANEQVAIRLVTQSQNQGPATSETLITANGLGQITTTIGVRCPVGLSTTHQVTARGLTTGRTSTAGAAC